ncbi:uncharacterized protein LOC105795853 [Gossypium raimondii]|uniref:uncharacterized protein LOC105795853 n=1 Tax=Gossypium raimondii TaxID=29730 RepID=UPI00063AB221|nr:uncharacterized protein LOC105795853 [Gossypium raimondii]
MDFVSRLPLNPTKKDSVWVIVDRLTKSAHFIPIRIDYSLQKLTKLYIAEIKRLHEIPVSIISYRVLRFTSRFWKKLHEALGTRLNFSIAYHPQTDGQSERSSIQMALYKALYGRRCCTPLCWTLLSERRVLGSELVSKIENTVKLIHDRLKVSFDQQKSDVELKRKDIEFSVGDQVFLKVSSWKKVLQFGHKGKLSPRTTIRVEQIHEIFHVSMLRRYWSDASHIVPVDEIELRPKLTFKEEPIQIIDHDVKMLRKKTVPLVKVLWQNHDTEEATWEPEA